jgi:hypothetical protein
MPQVVVEEVGGQQIVVREIVVQQIVVGRVVATSCWGEWYRRRRGETPCVQEDPSCPQLKHRGEGGEGGEGDGGARGGEAAGGGNGKAVGGYLRLILRAWHW